jgi:hypothetical protein
MQISDEMVEIAARAIHSAFQSGRGSPHPWPENVPNAQAPWLKEARAAIEAVALMILEEAAKVAAQYPVLDHGSLAATPHAAAQQAANEIASAIRKLGEE